MTALYREEPVAAEVSPAGVMEMLALRLNGFGARLLLSPFPPQPPPYLWGGGVWWRIASSNSHLNMLT